MTRGILWIGGPLLLTALVAIFLVYADPFRSLTLGTPPIEDLVVERVTLDGEEGISVRVRGAGPNEVDIAQVQVDGAYWEFRQVPEGSIAPLASAALYIPYPWVRGETHHLTFVTSTGLTFDHTIEVALPTPPMTGGLLSTYALVGLFIGVVPVAIGLLFLPALRSSGTAGLQFALALTVGLLLFLLIDTLTEGLEVAAQAAAGIRAQTVVWVAAIATCAGLLVIGRRGNVRPEGYGLAFYIALGIGLHNLGEGLAVGAAFSIGEATLASFLIMGFTLHNVTEGIGIAAPLARERLRWLCLSGLVALAGLPAVAGIWVGVYAYAPHWTALFFGIAAGAIFQVIIEVADYFRRESASSKSSVFSASSLLGLLCGFAIMYGTALVVQS